MKGREGILPSYNAQAGVDVDTHLIVTQHVTQAANDRHQIAPALTQLQQLPDRVGQATAILADAGYYSKANVQQCEDAGITPHIAKTRQGTTPLPKGQVTAPVKRMVARMATVAAKATYGKRKAPVETVFGILKQTMGLR